MVLNGLSRHSDKDYLRITFVTYRVTVALDFHIDEGLLPGVINKGKLMVIAYNGMCKSHYGCFIARADGRCLRLDILQIGRAGGPAFARIDVTNGLPLEVDMVLLLFLYQISAYANVFKVNLTCAISCSKSSHDNSPLFNGGLLINKGKVKIAFPNQALLCAFAFCISGPQCNRPHSPILTTLELEDLPKKSALEFAGEGLNEFPMLPNSPTGSFNKVNQGELGALIFVIIILLIGRFVSQL